jgi:hypothetical protein
MEIPILRAWELVVKGVHDYDQIKDMIAQWIHCIAPDSLINIHTLQQNSDLLVFAMSTWATTVKIMSSSKSFTDIFPDTIVLLCLLWDYNEAPFLKTTLGE